MKRCSISPDYCEPVKREEQTCQACNGTGWDKEPYDGGRKVCHKCGGAGRVQK